MFWHSRILQDDHLPALPVALWEPSHKWHTHTWRHRIPITRHNQLRAAQRSQSQAPDIPFESRSCSSITSMHSLNSWWKNVFLTAKRGNWAGTVWSNAGEGVKLLNLLMIMYCFHPSLHSSSSDQPSSFGCSWKENQEKGWTNCTYRTASQTMVATCCHTCACRT